ncbi:MAG: Ran-binding domain, partial [Paramarteilia canceri]
KWKNIGQNMKLPNSLLEKIEEIDENLNKTFDGISPSENKSLFDAFFAIKPYNRIDKRSKILDIIESNQEIKEEKSLKKFLLAIIDEMVDCFIYADFSKQIFKTLYKAVETLVSHIYQIENDLDTKTKVLYLCSYVLFTLSENKKLIKTFYSKNDLSPLESYLKAMIVTCHSLITPQYDASTEKLLIFLNIIISKVSTTNDDYLIIDKNILKRHNSLDMSAKVNPLFIMQEFFVLNPKYFDSNLTVYKNINNLSLILFMMQNYCQGYNAVTKVVSNALLERFTQLFPTKINDDCFTLWDFITFINLSYFHIESTSIDDLYKRKYLIEIWNKLSNNLLNDNFKLQAKLMQIMKHTRTLNLAELNFITIHPRIIKRLEISLISELENIENLEINDRYSTTEFFAFIKPCHEMRYILPNFVKKIQSMSTKPQNKDPIDSVYTPDTGISYKLIEMLDKFMISNVEKESKVNKSIIDAVERLEKIQIPLNIVPESSKQIVHAKEPAPIVLTSANKIKNNSKKTELCAFKCYATLSSLEHENYDKIEGNLVLSNDDSHNFVVEFVSDISEKTILCFIVYFKERVPINPIKVIKKNPAQIYMTSVDFSQCIGGSVQSVTFNFKSTSDCEDFLSSFIQHQNLNTVKKAEIRATKLVEPSLSYESVTVTQKIPSYPAPKDEGQVRRPSNDTTYNVSIMSDKICEKSNLESETLNPFQNIQLNSQDSKASQENNFSSIFSPKKPNSTPFTSQQSSVNFQGQPTPTFDFKAFATTQSAADQKSGENNIFQTKNSIFGLNNSLTPTKTSEVKTVFNFDRFKTEGNAKENSNADEAKNSNEESKTLNPEEEQSKISTREDLEEPGYKLLFNSRAKIYKYDKEKNEWLGRGVGMFKVLLPVEDDKDEKKVLLIMRREPLLKFSINAFVTKDTNFVPLQNNNPTMTSWVCLDYSSSNPEEVYFAIRFKTKEEQELFRKTVNDVVN